MPCRNGYAPLFSGDVQLWPVTGLLHDLDFEQFPDTHPACIAHGKFQAAPIAQIFRTRNLRLLAPILP